MQTRVEEIVRQFPQNGLRLLLETPGNVRDLLQLAGAEVLDLIDFEQLTRIQTTYVRQTFRHLESDVVLTAPLRSKKKGRSHQSILLYILIELQSMPDRWMRLRVIEYVMQIYRAQYDDAIRDGRSAARLRLQPVLPVVLYTGTRRWDHLAPMTELTEMGEALSTVMPSIEPLFVNVGATDSEKLETKGGFLGSVLRLSQQRHARQPQFRALLAHVMRRLDQMPEVEQSRWLELLSYIHALVYYERGAVERPELHETIEKAVSSEAHREGVTSMGKTIAEALKEEGWKKGRQEGRQEGAVGALRQALLLQLTERFSPLPKKTRQVVESTSDIDRLNTWLVRVVTATSLADLDIKSGVGASEGR